MIFHLIARRSVMGLFKNDKVNSKEILSVIKNLGPADTLMWKVPEEDFAENSTLIVAESETALFCKDGVIEQVFEAGKYQLETNNYPFITRLQKKLTGGVSTFNCKMYYVRKAHSLELKWGTSSPIQVRDPVYNLQTTVKAHGSYSLRVVNPKKFLIKMIGNNVGLFTRDSVSEKFRSLFLQKITSTIAKEINTSQREIVGICAYQDELADKLVEPLAEKFDEYGLEVVNFYIASITIPEDDPNRKVLEQSFADQLAQINAAKATRAELDIVGKDWDKVQDKGILKDLANNPNGGGIASLGAGLSMGVAAGNIFGSMSQNMNQQTSTPNPQQINQSALQVDTVNCAKCNAPNVKTSKFCSECGEKIVVVTNICSNCNAELPAGAKFCSECGQKVELETIHCTNCGKELSIDAKFCADCGTKVNKGDNNE